MDNLLKNYKKSRNLDKGDSGDEEVCHDEDTGCDEWDSNKSGSEKASGSADVYFQKVGTLRYRHEICNMVLICIWVTI